MGAQHMLNGAPTNRPNWFGFIVWVRQGRGCLLGANEEVIEVNGILLPNKE